MDLHRRHFVALMLSAAASAAALRVATAQGDPLPSWGEGPARKAILDFVKNTTDQSGATFVPPEDRVACFDQDGTLWVEQPVYTQIVYCFDRVPDLVKAKPGLADEEPFKTVLSGDRARIARLSMDDLIRIVGATLTGMDVEVFREQVVKWIASARDPRWKRPYTDLVYLPQIELLRHLRANGYKTFIVTGGGQDFVRAYAESVYDIPPEQIVGTAGAVKYQYDAEGRPVLIKEPKLLLNDDKAGKPEGIHLMIGRRPRFAFGNSSGDREMCEYTTAGEGARLAMLLLHDDADREYAYGPAEGLPDSKVGPFPQTLYDEARDKGWIVVSMKKDWNRVFAWAN
jgi:phosphoglycolate phosphatase-like HAD superfamily hydrolase